MIHILIKIKIKINYAIEYVIILYYLDIIILKKILHFISFQNITWIMKKNKILDIIILNKIYQLNDMKITINF